LSKVTQILLNILSNAIDALHEQSNACICSKVCFEQDYLKVTISDNGPGMDSALLDRVFEPFYTTKSTGTGLGLMICKRLSDSISARIEINSTPGDGTYFNLYLPLTNGEQ
jgi:signal transduction histidine kinase